MNLPPTLEIAVTLRDFDASSHPDFEFKRAHEAHAIHGLRLDLGIVGSDIEILDRDRPEDQRDPNNRKPIYNGGSREERFRSTNSKERFDQWYRDTPGINSTHSGVVLDLTLDAQTQTYKFGKDPNGVVWGTQGIITNATGNYVGFFPLDGLTTGPDGQPIKRRNGIDGKPHNFHFTLELHHQFEYTRGQQFTFIGDDDLWVFINGKRVVDLGGLHNSETASVNLDTLGLTEGQIYHFDLFYAERHTVEANFFMETSIAFVPTVGIAAIKDAQEPTSFRSASNGAFRVSLGRRTAKPLSVNYTVGGSALRDHYQLTYADGTLLGSAIAIPADTTELTILVVPTRADANTVDDTVEITLLPGNSYEVVQDAKQSEVIIADYIPPAASIERVQDAVEPQPFRAAVNGSFLITLDQPPQEDIRIPFQVGGSAARASFDLQYGNSQPLTGTVVFPKGIDRRAVFVVPKPDTNFRDDTVIMTLLDDGNSHYTIDVSQATIVIADYLPPIATIEPRQNAKEPARGETPESNKGLFAIRLTDAAPHDLMVNFDVVSHPAHAQEGTDYRHLPRQVQLTKGSRMALLPVFPLPDQQRESPEPVRIVLQPGQGYRMPEDGQSHTARILIADMVVPPLPVVTVERIRDAQEPLPGETVPVGNMGLFRFTIQGGAIADQTQVNFTIVSRPGNAQEGVDYNPLPRSVVINKNQGFAQIPVIPKADPATARVFEGPEPVTISLLPSEAYRLSENPNLQSATLWINDQKVIKPPVIELTAADPEAVEPSGTYQTRGDNTGTFLLAVIHGELKDDLKVSFGIRGDAEPGTDYVLELEDGTKLSTRQRSNVVVMPKQQPRLRIHVVPLADFQADQSDRDDQVVMSLDPVSNNADYRISKRVATVRIGDRTIAKPH